MSLATHVLFDSGIHGVLAKLPCAQPVALCPVVIICVSLGIIFAGLDASIKTTTHCSVTGGINDLLALVT